MTGKNIYMIGIGGMGMGPLAIYLSQLGNNVSGMDDQLNDDVKAILFHHGIQLHTDHVLHHNYDLVVYSSAISENHKIYKEAKKKGIMMKRRGEVLSEVLAGKKVIAVAGSHGKSSTCGLLTHALKKIGFEFGYVLGAYFKDKNAHPGKYSDSPWVVIELDESDGTIECFSPEYTLMTNFDWDHQARYKQKEDLLETYRRLFQRTQAAVIIPDSCKYLETLVQGINADVYKYGEEGEFRGRMIESLNESYLQLDGKFERSNVSLSDNAEFNAKNALLALVGVKLLSEDLTVDLFKDYKGIKRRQEFIYEDDTISVMIDYAHHPTELNALIDYAKKIANGRLIVLFQPHRYTRTKQYYREFAMELCRLEKSYLLPVYAASEAFDEEGTSQKIMDEVSNLAFKNVHYLESGIDDILKILPTYNEPEKTFILFVGAGDIENMARQYVKTLEEDKAWVRLEKQISSETILKKSEALAKKTTFVVGGPARYYAEPANESDLLNILNFAKHLNLPLFVLGRGSNLIVPDEGFNGLVLRLSHDYWKTIQNLGNGKLYATAGVRLKELCGRAAKDGLAGFEPFEGIPGCVGGGLRMNAGAMGSWLFDVVESVRMMTSDGQIIQKSKEDMKIGYRCCHDLVDNIVLGATFIGQTNTEVAKINEKMHGYSVQRKASQPRESSAGCIFKNPEGHYAGRLIELSGMKGQSLGGAEVSTVHGNFIINRGNATAADLINLVKRVRQEVYHHTGIQLEPEVLLLGKKWEDQLVSNDT